MHCKFCKTTFMNKMMTWRYLTRLSGCMNIFKAYRTIGPRQVFNALKSKDIIFVSSLPCNTCKNLTSCNTPSISVDYLTLLTYPMFSFQVYRQAHITSFAMKIIFLFANSANATSLAMKLLFTFLVIK